MLVRSYAKVNLTLNITGRRPDGYHLLDSLFCTVDLCDEIAFDFSAPSLHTTVPNGPGIEDNLTDRAARLFFQSLGLQGGCAMTLFKRIPQQAGLGGGSGNAAAVLTALNAHFGGPLSRAQLHRMAERLGADVPFALQGGLARVEGIGETITPLSPPRPLFFVIAKPCEGLSTKAIFACYDADPPRLSVDNPLFYQALVLGDAAGLYAYGGNVLEKAARAQLPILGTLVDALYQKGAAYAAMTGSGAAVFGLFWEQREAALAQKALAPLAPFCVCCSAL